MSLLEVLAQRVAQAEVQSLWLLGDGSGAQERAARLLRMAKVLLYLHARPCRTYSEQSLGSKLGFVCGHELQQLVQLGLVVQSDERPSWFGYGVEDAAQLRAVDELSRRYHALAALTGFLASLSRLNKHKARARAPALRVHMAKPNQCAGQEKRHVAAGRSRRPLRVSLSLALQARAR
jgi:hypothetical protein